MMIATKLGVGGSTSSTNNDQSDYILHFFYDYETFVDSWLISILELFFKCCCYEAGMIKGMWNCTKHCPSTFYRGPKATRSNGLTYIFAILKAGSSYKNLFIKQKTFLVSKCIEIWIKCVRYWRHGQSKRMKFLM